MGWMAVVAIVLVVIVLLAAISVAFEKDNRGGP